VPSRTRLSTEANTKDVDTGLERDRLMDCYGPAFLRGENLRAMCGSELMGKIVN
jgi:hypothetical protein